MQMQVKWRLHTVFTGQPACPLLPLRGAEQPAVHNLWPWAAIIAAGAGRQFGQTGTGELKWDEVVSVGADLVSQPVFTLSCFCDRFIFPPV